MMAFNLSRLAGAIFFVLIAILSVSARAQSSGDFDYAVNSDGVSVSVTGYTGTGGDLIIPSTINNMPVTGIGSFAFNANMSVTGVTIPDSVNTLGDYAFYGCSGLIYVKIGAGLSSIGDWSFEGCSKLVSAIFYGNAPAVEPYSNYLNNPGDLTAYDFTPASGFNDEPWNGVAGVSTTTIGPPSSSEQNTTGMAGTPLSYQVLATSYPNNYSATGLPAALVCGTMTGLISGTPSVAGTFTATVVASNPSGSGTAALTIVVEPLSFTYSVENGQITITGFTGADSAVIIPAAINGMPVTAIGEDAFGGESFASVTIPGSVVTIGNGAFAGCSNLASAYFTGDAPGLGTGAFDSTASGFTVYCFNGATGFTAAAWNSYPVSDFSYTVINTAAIGPGASGGEVTITGYTGTAVAAVIPATIAGMPVTAIGNEAFQGQTTLQSVSIPDDITAIGNEAFAGCSGLVNVTIPTSVTAIGDGAFAGCSGLTSVTIPDSVSSIGNHTFMGCSGLTSVTIPDSIGSIGNQAFMGCSGLSSVSIPASVTEIGADAFGDCASLASIMVDPANGNYESVDGILFRIPDNGVLAGGQAALVQYPGGKAGGYYIPDGITAIGPGGYNIPDSVTAIGSGAFSGCDGLTTLLIPKSVTSIGSDAFLGCSSLTSITVTPLNSNFSSIDGVLFDNSQTVLLGYPEGRTGSYIIPNGVTNIGEGAFEENDGLTGIAMPRTLQSIGSEAFEDCDGLTSVIIPGSVTSIGPLAFAGCGKLTSLSMAAPNAAFSSLAGILFNKNRTEIVQYAGGKSGGYMIPSTVVSIGTSSFQESDGLTRVSFPATVKSIGDDAFGRCANLAAAYFSGSAPAVGAAIFNSAATGFTVYYLTGAAGFTSPTWNGYPSVALGPTDFSSLRGSYEGPVKMGGPTAGKLALTMTGKGSFTAALTLGKARYPVNGVFSTFGIFDGEIDAGATTLTVDLSVAPSPPNVIGTVTASTAMGRSSYTVNCALLPSGAR